MESERPVLSVEHDGEELFAVSLGESLMEEFIDDRNAGDDDDDEPELVLVSDGERFYRHHTRQPSQYWACPLLLQDRCRDCRWFTEDAGGQPRCTAIAKVMARHHVQFHHFGLEELRDLLERGRPGAFA
jgi:hypothetical protein